MKKLISLVLCLALIASVLVACTPDGCAHQYVDGICKHCQETDANYTPAQGGSGQTNTCDLGVHTYVDGVCKLCNATDSSYVEPIYQSGNLYVAGNGKYLLADENGNYGGTINRGKYGDGAPLNGRYDSTDLYYTRNDYYHMQSTVRDDGVAGRTIYTGFSGYQQRMERDSGIALSVAVLNYWGEAVSTETEEELVAKYEEINNTTIATNGETSTGLANLWQSMGYTAAKETFVSSGSTRQEFVKAFRDWIEPKLAAGEMVFVRGQDNKDNRWKLIIGYDNVGTDDYSTDDVVIFVDPYDTWDHYQDGYTTSAAGRFERWWYDVSLAGKVTNKYEAFVIKPKQAPTITRIKAEDDPTRVIQELPENPLIRNRASDFGGTEGSGILSEGSYGGSYNPDKFGIATPYNGYRDQPTLNYHKYLDVHNLVDTSTRTICEKYRGFMQTHKSSCGLCATFSITMYYGFDRNVFNQETIVATYESVNNTKVYNKGSGAASIKLALESLGVTNIEYGQYLAENWQTDMPFPTYESFVAYTKLNLDKDQPIAVSHRPHGGHWCVIIGYDDMGTEYIYDDVIMLADSGDSWDHFEDGFDTYAATLFYRQWYNSKYATNQSHFVINRAGNEGIMLYDNNQK